MKRPTRIGLTGGIGSGKSTVGRMLVDLGAWLVDTDAISRALTAAGGAGIGPIRETFGPDFIDAAGALDRTRMRDLVFRDPDARRRLESLLHPLIGQETLRQASQALPGQPVVYDVPLLVESGRWRALVDRVLVVDCTPATQIERVVQRSGLAAVEVERIIAQQASREARLRAADAVIFNDGLDLDQLREEVRALWAGWGG
ncbi:MAG: dephospho-CoA kinase [Pseudomonadota bacterium]|uniref:Dephospho-CoA kinase n=1 Tax=Caldimonas aquatica TaxID=376175 RepID=A0ABY6MTX9_9BURK|nr:dephospho-CoA kinase [Schlegelella aquatica]UZD55449.1 dephospho-CoA kinase [Schlegelella aquatica]